MRPKLLWVVVAVFVCFALAPTSFATNLLTNGSFETGDFTGWTTGGNFEFTGVQSGGCEDGNFCVYMGPVGSDGTLSQTVATTAGDHYTFSFWFQAFGDSPSDFSAYWNGTQLLSLIDPNTGGEWTQFSYDVVGTGSDTISFAFADSPSYMYLDNVSVEPPVGPSTPEPGSLILLGTGVLGLAGTLRRKLR